MAKIKRPPILAEIEHRHLLVMLIGVAIGITAADLSMIPIVLGMSLLLLFRKLEVRLFFLVSIALGAVLSPPSQQNPALEEAVLGQFRVVSVPMDFAEESMCEVEHYLGRFRLKFDHQADIQYGDVLSFASKWTPLSEVQIFRDPHTNLLGTLSIKGGEYTILQRGPPIYRLAQEWRRSFASFSRRQLGEERASILNSLAFNADGDLRDEFRDNLQRTGTIHIISASGLHVLIFAIFIEYILSFLPLPRWIAYSILISVLSFYAMAAGLRPPIVRAVVMGAVFYAAFFFRRLPDALAALSFAGVGFLISDAKLVYDLGFQLSFITVFFLALYQDPNYDQERTGLSKHLYQASFALKQSMIATVATAPIIGYVFGLISLISIIANILIVSVLMPLTAGALIAWVLSFWLLPVSDFLMSWVVTPLLGWVDWVVNKLGNITISAAVLPTYSSVWVFGIIVAILCTWRPKYREA